MDILRKAPPRFRSLSGPATVGKDSSGAADYVTAITASLLDLDRSYLAVQGPPGTGKTYVGSHVIARLVGEGWKIGVVGQSHAVVENMLCTAIETAGVDPDRVAKKLSTRAPGSVARAHPTTTSQRCWSPAAAAWWAARPGP